jgi:hypothetical protein
MWFLFKGSVFFAAILVVLSYFGSKPVIDPAGASGVEIGDAISAATGAYTYLAAMCAEKPDVCEKGGETLSALGIRATEGARVAFELLDKQFGAQSTDVALRQDPDPAPFPAEAVHTQSVSASSDALATGAIPLPLKRPAH